MILLSRVHGFLVLQLWPCHRTNLDDNLSKNQEKYHHGSRTADTDPQSRFPFSVIVQGRNNAWIVEEKIYPTCFGAEIIIIIFFGISFFQL